MVSVLIGLHAAFGEIGAIGFLWVLVELINPTEDRVKRAKIVALISVILFFLSWFSGGYYYVNEYGENVKPIIKAGPQPWAHLVLMETKEHAFFFLPFLAILATAILFKYEKEILENRKIRNSIIALSIIIFLLAFAIGGMGYLISSGARAALEVAG